MFILRCVSRLGYKFILRYVLILTFSLQSFFSTIQGHRDNFFTHPHWAQTFFCNVYCLSGLFSLVLMFPGLKIEAPVSSTVQGKCIYTFLKWRSRKFNFRSYVLNLVKISITFCLSKVRSSGSDFSRIERTYLSAFGVTIVKSSGPIYRPSIPIRQDFWVDLSVYRSPRVTVCVHI